MVGGCCHSKSQSLRYQTFYGVMKCCCIVVFSVCVGTYFIQNIRSLPGAWRHPSAICCPWNPWLVREVDSIWGYKLNYVQYVMFQLRFNLSICRPHLSEILSLIKTNIKILQIYLKPFFHFCYTNLKFDRPSQKMKNRFVDYNQLHNQF